MKRKAFSLLEIMIVLVIVGIVGYILYPKMFTKPAEEAKTNISQGTQMVNSIKNSIELQNNRQQLPPE